MHSPQSKEIFKLPPAPQHFRIQSERTLDYQWSLYMLSAQAGDGGEEFLEGQKVNLKPQWTEYLKTRPAFQETSIEFNEVKCTLNYLVVIGESAQAVVETVQGYYESNHLNPEKAFETKPTQVEPPENPAILQQESRAEETPGSALLESEVKKITKKGSAEKELALSPSEIELANDIHEEVRQSEMRDPVSVSTPKVVSEVKEKETPAPIPEEPAKEEPKKEETPKEESEKKEGAKEEGIKLTDSQLMDSSGKVVTPFFKSKKFIVLLVVLLLLLAGGGFAAFSMRGAAEEEKQQPKKRKAKKGRK